MTETLMIDNLQQRLNPAIKNAYWLQFVEAVAEELYLQREEKLKKLYMFNIDSLTSQEVRDLATSMLGYRIDVSLTEDVDFVRKICKAIPWMIVNKTIYPSFDFIFKSIERSGYVYNLYYSLGEDKLIRIIKWDDPNPYDDSVYKQIEAYTDYTLPFTKFIPNTLASIDFLSYDLTLDDIAFEIDAPVTLYLDTRVNASSSGLTKHVSLEYNIDSIVTVNGIDYLFTSGLFEYLRYNGNYNRKVTDIAHYGCNITIPVNFNAGYEVVTTNTVPLLNMNITVYDYFDVSLTDFVITGIAEYEDGTELNIGYFPITTEEVKNYNMSNIITGIFKSRFNTKKYNSPFGTTVTDNLGLVNITPFSVDGFILMSNSSKIVLLDNGLGKLICTTDNLSGIIDYSTGDFSVYFYKYNPHNVTSTSITPPVAYSTGYTFLETNTVKISFTCNGTNYEAFDDGLGDFGLTIIQGTVINYNTGVINFVCSYAITNLVLLFNARENFSSSFTADELWIDYNIDERIRLKQVNLYNSASTTNHLLCETTFPFIELTDIQQHVSFQWLFTEGAVSLQMLDIENQLDNDPLLRVDLLT